MAQVPELQTPQPINLLGQYAQVQQIKGAQQEQQARAMQLQREQMAMGSQQALMQAYTQSGGDLDKTFESATKSGKVLPGDLIKLKEATLTQKQKALEYVNAKGDRAVKEADLMQGAHDQVAALPPEQRPQAWQQALGQLQNAGVDISQAPQQYPGDQAFSQMGLQLKGHAAMVAEAAKKLENDKTVAQTAEATGKAAQATAEAGKITQESQFGPTGPAAKSKYNFLLQKKNAGKPLSPDETAFMQAQDAGDARDVQVAARKAGSEAAARQPYEMALAKQKQALSQGDPDAAAKLLVDGDATLSELKSRGATPEFIAKTLTSAKKMSNGQYNAQSSEAQFKVAQSPAQVQFFGSAKSLVDKGGTLDQLAETAKKIPQNQIPAFNSIEDWAKAAAGNGPLAEYAARVLGVADDYSKVMGGGTGSDASRLQAANLVSAKLSKEGREGALAGIRGSVNSQISSRIGDNQVLKRMYGGQNQQQTTQPSTSGGGFDWNAHPKAN